MNERADADPVGADRTPASEFPDDPERVAAMRALADDLRERGGERAGLLAAVVYRVSDLYDPEQPSDTDPEDVYRNMRNVLRVTERGTLARDADPDGGER
ncbi:hypothetical protein BRD18_03695 [Halobacteriales archaeon SW_7_71_33]|nr:MAG: hypothetical protein BRD18_03695 [Halobacteriales archaeon SW_7_71_33]